jgi:hypothetical protein
MFEFLLWNVDFGMHVSLLVWTNQVCAVSLDFGIASVQIKRGHADKQTNKQTNRKWLLYK